MLSLKKSTHFLRLACVSFVGETEKFTGTENVDTINIARNVVSVSLMLFFWFLSYFYLASIVCGSPHTFLSGKIRIWCPTSQILNKKSRSSDLDLFLFKNLGEVPKPLFFYFHKKRKDQNSRSFLFINHHSCKRKCCGTITYFYNFLIFSL